MICYFLIFILIGDTLARNSWGLDKSRLLNVAHPGPSSNSNSRYSSSNKSAEEDICSNVSASGNTTADGLPLRFLKAAKGDIQEGWRRFHDTLAWRHREKIDTILQEKNDHFQVIKRHYPHYFHLRGWNNEPVYYEKPAKMNISAMKSQGMIQVIDALLFYFFRTIGIYFVFPSLFVSVIVTRCDYG